MSRDTVEELLDERAPLLWREGREVLGAEVGHDVLAVSQEEPWERAVHGYGGERGARIGSGVIEVVSKFPERTCSDAAR